MPKTTSNPSFLSAAAMSFASLAGLRSAEACAYAEFPTTSATRRSAYATDEIVRKKLRAHKMTRKGPSPREGFISELSCSMNRANDAILALQEQDARRPSFLKDPLSSTIAQADPFSRQRSRCLPDLRRLDAEAPARLEQAKGEDDAQCDFFSGQPASRTSGPNMCVGVPLGSPFGSCEGSGFSLKTTSQSRGVQFLSLAFALAVPLKWAGI